MSQKKPSDEDLKEREERAKEWITFRKRYVFTQRRLAEILGLSRRTVQMIEAAKITPHPSTIRVFNILKAKHHGGR